jgi:hypothetical protein
VERQRLSLEDLAKMDPDEKEVLNTLMAQVDALELVLKMVISVQPADHVVVRAGDPKKFPHTVNGRCAVLTTK